MADPFEVRLRFMNLLTHLTASTNSSMKTASFALKHRDMDEDLHSCILESLDNTSTSVNARANIMYFVEHFCDVAAKPADGHAPYVEMVRRDILKIVAGVVGRSGSGMGANAKVARKVVENLRVKGVLTIEAVQQIDGDLKRKEAERSRVGDETGQDEREVRHEREKKHEARDKQSGGGGAAGSTQANKRDAKKDGSKVDKRAIEQRLEEDRERNKRLRESVWAVEGDDQDELDKMWEETSDLCEDDYQIAKEEADERAQFARYHKSLLLEAAR